MRYKYTNEDIEFLKENYPIGNWNKITERFPNVSRMAICSKMSKLGIKSNHRPIDKKSPKRKLKWTDEEIEILKNKYSNCLAKDITEFLPNRSVYDIRTKAVSLGLKSHYSIFNKWIQEDEQYIIDNWELEPDRVMAVKLNRTFRSVKWKREELGLYRRDMNANTYPTLSKYLRGQNQKWKVDSMKQCNYQCVLTGSKDFEIHHLYGVSNIIEDMFRENKDLYKESFSDYTEKELSFILAKFLEIQNNYPLGECIDKKLHILFHSLYGQYYNTPEQWHRFKEDYLKGIYKNID